MDNNMHCKMANDFNVSAIEQLESTADTTISMETKTPQKQKRSSAVCAASNFNMSNSSLSESNTCLTHQYHYIQYHPAYYQYITNQQHTAAMPQVPAASALAATATASNCNCSCSCGSVPNQAMRLNATNNHFHRNNPNSVDSQMAVAVIVHRQASSTTAAAGATEQSEQSLLNHSYQALQPLQDDVEKKPLNVLGNSKLNISCDCDLECTCGASASAAAANADSTDASNGTITNNLIISHRTKQQSLADAMLGIDEITVSESDNNSTMIKKKKGRNQTAHANKKFNSWCVDDSAVLTQKNSDSHYNSSQADIYCDSDDKSDKSTHLADNRPPLPPRPPRPRNLSFAAHHHGSGIKKYVVWCLICGGFSCLLGILFLGVYFLLHSYTITVGNFETVPTFVPAALLILTGLCIMSLARRRNRYSYLIKLSGACGLISALTCALVTVTTTVLHMSRLQALRECEYAQKTRTCTCYSDMIESQVDRVDKEGVRLVFDSLSDCGVVHGSLYSCLRAIFGLSVAGVLIAVFSCMLVYQLLSHERKKMYWEQLELRCRSLYTSQQGPPTNMAAAAAVANTRGPAPPVCRCCEQCHAHRQVPLQAATYPWDDGGEPRFWTGQPPGNFYSPNPGGDDLTGVDNCRGLAPVGRSNRATTGWSWPRMPWQRNNSDNNSHFRQTPSSPDSQYGFSNNMPVSSDNIMAAEEVVTGTQFATAQHFNVVSAPNLPYGVWGPPPPYSDPNSPARRGYYYIQPNPCNNGNGSNQTERPMNTSLTNESHMIPCLSHHRSAFIEQSNGSGTTNNTCCAQTSNIRNQTKRQAIAGNVSGKSKGNGEYENTPSESDGGTRDRFSNTLPTPRKLKKRMEGAKSIGPNTQSTPRISVQQVFAAETNYTTNENHAVVSEQCSADNSDEANVSLTPSCNNTVRMLPCKQTPRQKRSAPENTNFQCSNSNNSAECIVVHEGVVDPAESEVYFADVSSCCNMSIKNDNYYEDANKTSQHHPHPHSHHQHQNSNCSHNSGSSKNNNNNSNVSNNEDYLAQRFGQRENSIRSRLPFPQTLADTYDDNLNISNNAINAVPTTMITNNQMQKEISRQSMCSIESEAKTEFTDLSPSTPCSNKFVQTQFVNATNNKNRTADEHVIPPPNFVATFPYSSESQSLEAHRRSTKDIHELMLTQEAHYEVINEPTTCQFAMASSAIQQQHGTHKATNDRLNKRNEISHKTKSKSRERLDTPSEMGNERLLL